jgi:hypothetical protein
MVCYKCGDFVTIEGVLSVSSLRDFRIAEVCFYYNTFTPSALKKARRAGSIVATNMELWINPEGLKRITGC